MWKGKYFSQLHFSRMLSRVIRLQRILLIKTLNGRVKWGLSTLFGWRKVEMFYLTSISQAGFIATLRTTCRQERNIQLFCSENHRVYYYHGKYLVNRIHLRNTSQIWWIYTIYLKVNVNKELNFESTKQVKRKKIVRERKTCNVMLQHPKLAHHRLSILKGGPNRIMQIIT